MVMARARQFRVRRWVLAATAVLLWIALSTAWSWYLINQAFERDMTSRLASRAMQLAEASREQLQLSADPSATRPAAVDLENQPQLQTLMEQSRRSDLEMAYAMVWTADGTVVAHSRRESRLTGLDSTEWPALEGNQPFRLAKLTAKTPQPGQVVAVTVPVNLKGKVIAYVSVVYSQQWLADEFWRSQSGLLGLSAGATLVGVIVLLFAIHLVAERLEKRQREIQQTALARTSLLTERGMLASVLAHEVRSPLTALRFNLHSLRTLIGGRSTDIDRQVELTDRCEREIRRLDGMLNDFLQRTQVIGPVESASVNNVVREAMEFLRPALERNNIRISVHLDAADPLVHVHPDELRQVILNLSANGQDAMPKGGTLAVSTLADSDEVPEANATDSASPIGPTVTILIRDSGTGIPPELHQRIFEPFFSTKPNGSGLGLALVRRVVSGAGGTVFCESVVGEGTTFRIVLPRASNTDAGPVQAGQGYAHVRRDEAVEIDESPEIVIDRAAERASQEARSEGTNVESVKREL
jgi:signal transduction histidine kinase